MRYFSPPAGSEGKLALCVASLPFFPFFPEDKLPSGFRRPFRYKMQFWLLWLVARGGYERGFTTSGVQKAC